MSGGERAAGNRKSVEFSVKGPLGVGLEERGGGGAATGCSVLDLNFAASSTVGQIVFTNYYTASVSVLVQYDAPTLKTRWIVSVLRKVLMRHPHLDEGSQDLFSIVATDSQVDWRKVKTMRLVLRQPSPLWKSFHIEDIHVYSDMPETERREPGRSESERVLALVRRQTLESLLWKPPAELRTTSSSTNIPHAKDSGKGPAPYEIQKLPQP